MHGKIIHYNDSTQSGLISGEDGIRYNFKLSDWVDKKKPLPGMKVGFQCQDRSVLCVCPV